MSLTKEVFTYLFKGQLKRDQLTFLHSVISLLRIWLHVTKPDGIAVWWLALSPHSTEVLGSNPLASCSPRAPSTLASSQFRNMHVSLISGSIWAVGMNMSVC